MKCKVIAMDYNGDPDKEIGDQLVMSGKLATALQAGQVTATLRYATIDGIFHNGVAIDGFVPTENGRWLLQRWWCAVGDGKEGAK